MLICKLICKTQKNILIVAEIKLINIKKIIVHVEPFICLLNNYVMFNILQLINNEQ